MMFRSLVKLSLAMAALPGAAIYAQGVDGFLLHPAASIEMSQQSWDGKTLAGGPISNAPYFLGYPDYIGSFLRYKSDFGRTEWAKKVVEQAAKFGVSTLSVPIAQYGFLTPRFQVLIAQVDAFNSKLSSATQKIGIRLLFSPIKSVFEEVFTDDLLLKNDALKFIERKRPGVINYNEAADSPLLLLGQDPCLPDGKQANAILDGHLIMIGSNGSSSSIRAENCYLSKSDTSRSFRAYVGVVPSVYADKHFNNKILNLASRAVNIQLAAQMGMLCRNFQQNFPNTPLKEVNIGYDNESGELTLVNSDTKALRDMFGRSESNYDISFSDRPLTSQDLRGVNFSSRYDFFKKRQDTWAKSFGNLTAAVKAYFPDARVSVYAHPNLPIKQFAMLDFYRFCRIANVDLINSSWMPPETPDNKVEDIKNQLAFTSSLARQLNAPWRLDFSWPTVSWKYTSASFWNTIIDENCFYRKKIEKDFDGDDVDEIISNPKDRFWNSDFLSPSFAWDASTNVEGIDYPTAGCPTGMENLQTFLNSSQAMAEMGGGGMNYSNWPTHWFVEGKKEGNVPDGWNELLGNDADATRATRRMAKFAVDRQAPLYAVYVNSAARLACEDAWQGDVGMNCSPMYFAKLAEAVKQKYNVKSVDFITDDYIANNSICRYKEIVMDPNLSIPTGVALDAWKRDPQYAIVEAKLRNQKGCLAAVGAARSLLLD